MLQTLVRKEILDHLLSRRFLVLSAIGSLLIFLSLFSGYRYYQTRLLDYRSVESLAQQQVEDWHRQLARDSRLPNQQWETSGFQPFEMVESPEAVDGDVKWTIEELLTTKQLQEEGKSMHHCVGSYSSNCRKGNFSVWSMRVRTEQRGPIA